MGEFDLIQRYFTPASYSDDVLLGVGDDAAVVAVPPGFRLVAAVDTIVAGVHFPIDAAAADIAYRALAVNLSDMAAMGAQPRWFTLSLCIPEVRESWLAEFSTSLQQLAQRYDVQLIGGDTVKGPLNISIQILGIVESDPWLTAQWCETRRCGVCVGCTRRGGKRTTVVAGSVDTSRKPVS